jgi:hypothetical protein
LAAAEALLHRVTYGNEGCRIKTAASWCRPSSRSRSSSLSLGEDSLLPLTDNVEISGNSMAFPKDETTPWGTDGIRAYWQGEAASAIATKPVLGLATLRLKKLMALVPTTDELLDDANALTSYLPDKMAHSIRWKTNESILFGAGNGVPVGASSARRHGHRGPRKVGRPRRRCCRRTWPR